MIEFARPKTQAVTPEPQVKAKLLLKSKSNRLNINFSSSFVLKVLSLLLITSLKGIFLEPLNNLTT